MKITRIQTDVLLVRDYDPEAASSAQDDIIVRIHTDEGICGIGEVDTNPWVAREMIHARGTHSLGRGLEEMLLGENPLEPERIWNKLYEGSFMTGRRGLGICAIGAIDIALWDICGKASGQPVWKLLGSAAKPHVVPYASLLPAGRTKDQYRASLIEKAKCAKKMGFLAAKMEVCVNGPYSHDGLAEEDDAIVEIVAACRDAVGPDFAMMVDVCYCWNNADRALTVMKQLEPYNLRFLETPLQLDDLDGYARLHRESPIPIAAGELQNTRWEFLDLMDRGLVDIVQPDVGRVGGLTEARRVCRLAAERGRTVVPHCWKTGIGIAASVHMAAIAPNCAYVEFLPPQLAESALRRQLLSRELQVTDGIIPLPQEPGLGVVLNEDALASFRVGLDA